MSHHRGSPTNTRSPSRRNQRRSPTTNNRTSPTAPRPTVKRRPCQDIRGPQRLISYQIPKANPDKELNVIRAIIARETALQDLLAHVSKYKPKLVNDKTMTVATVCYGALDQKTTDLLLGTRITSVHVTEAIQDWRSQLTLPRPFVWQKKNYLQGMSCDTNFLHFDKCVAGILGNGRTKRNPFVTEGRNVDELARMLWGPNEEPKSVLVSGIDGMRLREAARHIVEEEMRCGKADHRAPPPTWYIQRKKRMLALGINLVAGASAPATNAAASRKTKPPPKTRKKAIPELDQIEELEEHNKKSSKNDSNKQKKRKRLLEMKEDEESKNDIERKKMTTEMKICSGRKRMWGWSRDGRMFMSSAEAWLTPPRPVPKPTPPFPEEEEGEGPATTLNAAGGNTTNATYSTSPAPTLSVATIQGHAAHFTVDNDNDNEEERMEVRVEITMGLPSKQGWCGTTTCSTLVVSMVDLRQGGFLPMPATTIDALLMSEPMFGKKKGKKSRNKNHKTKTKHSKKTNRKKEKEKNNKRLKEKTRIALGDDAIAFLLNRLIPTINGVSWERDGPFLKKINRKFGPLGMLGRGGSGKRTAKHKDPRLKFRVAFKLGKFWCAISAWVSRHDGLELDISTLCSHSKRLLLDRHALDRLLGSEQLLALGGQMNQEITRPHSRSSSRPNSRSASRPGSRSSSRPVSRGNGSSSLTASKSRPNSRPSSRSSSRPSSRPSSRGANRRKKNNASKSTHSITDTNYGALPPLNDLTMAVLQQCIVVVETYSGPEFFAQPSKKSINATDVSSDQTQDTMVGNAVLAPEIIAAANTSMLDTSPVKVTAGALMLSRGQTMVSKEDTMDDAVPRPITPANAAFPASVEPPAFVEPPDLVPDLVPEIVPEIVPPPRPKKHNIKVLAQAALVGGLYFMVDIHVEKDLFYVSATYPTSGKSICMTVSNSKALKCQLLRNNEAQKKVQEPKKEHTAEQAEQTPHHRLAEAVLSRLDLDYELPPGLMLRMEDDSEGQGTTGPLLALMANGVSPVRSVTQLMQQNVGNNNRPLSPLLPIFSPVLAVQKNSTSDTASISAVGRASQEKKMTEESSKEADVRKEGHQKTLSSVPYVESGVMRIALIPPK